MTSDGLRVLDRYDWPTAEWGVASLAVRCVVLFRRLGLEPREWEVDGLGSAIGGLCRLPSGRVVLVQELAHAVRHLGRRGPDVWVDASEVASVGVEEILHEVVSAMGLQNDEIDWTQDPSSQEEARRAAERVRQWRAGHRPTRGR